VTQEVPRLEQNAFDLMILFAAFVVVMALPIVIGLGAVFSERD
jgi:hypothetical protein